MLRYLPLVIAAVVAIPLTIYEGNISDRWNPINTQAVQCGILLDQIPMEIQGPTGLWVGEDQPEQEFVLKTAGAEGGYIKRVYFNQTTKEAVSIWFIVGHYRDIIRHTPNICYSAQGFKQIDHDIGRVPLGPEVIEPLTEEQRRMDGFYTTRFGKPNEALGGWEGVQRVYWGWWMPEPLEDGQEPIDPQSIRWVAPENQRLAFKYPRALYKLYFTVATSAEEEAADATQNDAAHKFAELFIPIANKAIAQSGAVMEVQMSDQAVAERKQEVRDRLEKLNEKYKAEREALEGKG